MEICNWVADGFYSIKKITKNINFYVRNNFQKNAK